MKRILSFLYSFFLFLFAVYTYAYVDPNLSYFKNVYSEFVFSNRLLATFIYSIFVIFLFIFYGVFVRLALDKKIHIKDISLLIAITAGILFLSYPAMLSYDIFNYIATSRVLFFYHENPYIVMPIEFIGDPLLAFTHATNKVALYGPFWILLTGISYLFGFGNFLAMLFSFKFLIVLFYLGTAFLIWKISRNLMSLILFALNPLIVIETLISGHNDIVMIFLVFLSLFLLMNKKIILGILFFILSIFIKYATILLLPIFIFIIWRIARGNKINFGNVFYNSSLAMYIGFLLSPIREEIYPWYAIWFLSFVCLLPNRKLLLYSSIAFSLSLLFRYIPYMIAGIYTTPVPLVKEIVSFSFPSLIFIYYVFKKK